MRRIAIQRAATLYQVITLAILILLGLAGHTSQALGVGHAGDEPSRATSSIEEQLGELHAAVVHFPIAMLLSAALSEVLLVTTGRQSFCHITRFAIWLGALGALSAAPLGWLAAKAVEDAPELLLNWHRWLGVSTALWSLATLWAGERAKNSRVLLRCLIGCAALLVAITGYLGGELVHNPQPWGEGVR
jgi:uncharacterized membrane protein